MTIKQFLNELLNKKWESDDLMWLILMVVIASMVTTPILGIPIGLLIYFYFFYEKDDTDNEDENKDTKE